MSESRNYHQEVDRPQLASQHLRVFMNSDTDPFRSLIGYGPDENSRINEVIRVVREGLVIRVIGKPVHDGDRFASTVVLSAYPDQIEAARKKLEAIVALTQGFSDPGFRVYLEGELPDESGVKTAEMSAMNPTLFAPAPVGTPRLAR